MKKFLDKYPFLTILVEVAIATLLVAGWDMLKDWRETTSRYFEIMHALHIERLSNLAIIQHNEEIIAFDRNQFTEQRNNIAPMTHLENVALARAQQSPPNKIRKHQNFLTKLYLYTQTTNTLITYRNLYRIQRLGDSNFYNAATAYNDAIADSNKLLGEELTKLESLLIDHTDQNRLNNLHPMR